MPGADAAQASPETASRPEPEPSGPAPRPRSPALFVAAGFALLLAVQLLPRERPAPPAPAAPASPPAPEAPAPAAAPVPAPPALHALPLRDPKDGIERRRIEGSVFLLGSLRPARGALLLFRDAADGTWHGTRADRRGRFSALLEPKPSGYHLQIAHGDAPLRFVEDWAPSLRTLPKGKREELARDLLGRAQDEELIVFAGAVLRRDYAVAPMRKESEDDAR